MLFAVVAQQALAIIDADVRKAGAAADLLLAALIQPKAGVSTDFVSCLWHDDLVIAITAETGSP